MDTASAPFMETYPPPRHSFTASRQSAIVGSSETPAGYAAVPAQDLIQRGIGCEATEPELPERRRCLSTWQEHASTDTAQGQKLVWHYVVVTRHSPLYTQCIVALVVLVRSVAGRESRMLHRNRVWASSRFDFARQVLALGSNVS